MAKPTVADYLLERLRAWDVTKVFAYPGDGINGILAAWGGPTTSPRSSRPGTRRWPPSRPSATPSSPASSASAWPPPGPGRSTCSTGSTTPSSTTCRSSRSSGRPAGRAMGGSYQQEVDLLSLFKDVASEYVQMVTVPEQLPNVLDRAIRVALAERAPTAIIIPSDVQELEYSAPTHAFKMVPSSLGIDWPTAVPQRRRDRPRGRDPQRRAARSRSWPARAPAERRAELEQVAELLGAGVAKPLLGKDVLSDDLPYVTGSIGLLGTRPSYELMQDCDTLLTVGSSFPYTQFLPDFDQARAVQIDIDGKYIGMRYPYELNLVGDARGHPAGADPAAAAQGGPVLAGGHRGQGGPVVGDHGAGGHGRGRPGQPDAAVPRAVDPAARRRDRHRGLRLVGQLVRAPAEVPRRHPRLAVGQPGHHGTGRALRDRRQVRPPGPAR